MASLVTEADVWTNTMTVPDDGDTRNAASVTAAGVGFQVAADRSRYLRNRNVAAVGGSINIPLVWTHADAQWAGENAALQARGIVHNVAIGAAGSVWFNIPYIFNGAITGVSVSYDGLWSGGGSRAGLPGTMPSMTVQAVSALTGAVVTLGTQTDTSASVAAFEAPHEIAVTFAARDFTTDENLTVGVGCETGANAQVGSAILRIYATIATT